MIVNIDTKPDWKALMEHMKKEGRIAKEHCEKILRDTYDLIKEEPNLMKLNDPVTVVGDLHG